RCYVFFFFFSSRRRHTRFSRDWSSDVCSSDLFPATDDNPALCTVVGLQDCHTVYSAGLSSVAGNGSVKRPKTAKLSLPAAPGLRSEERRVGKECRTRAGATQ